MRHPHHAIALLVTTSLALWGCGMGAKPSPKPVEGSALVTQDEQTTTPEGDQEPSEDAPTRVQEKEAAVSALAARLDGMHPANDGDGSQNTPALMRSYDTDQIELKDTAYSYDNALAAMAFLSEGDDERATQLLDALSYAVKHDRYRSGRIRNAYAAGEVSTSGQGNSVNLPGWYDEYAGSWYEDSYQVGSNVGNTSYVALALMHYTCEGADNPRAEHYLTTARMLMDWVLEECSDDADGFLAGYDGWPESEAAIPLTYKSTEHNIDAYAAFSQLYVLTGEVRYQKAAKSALRFVKSMYNEEARLFFTGTLSDGVTPSVDNVVLDAQVWSALALGDEFAPYEGALTQLEYLRTGAGGYRFHVCDEDAYWCEGTAFTALMHKLRGENERAEKDFDALCAVQLESGLFPAATADDLTTGIYLDDGSPWLYGTAPHVAPTAWFVMACNGYNPYSFE